MKTKQEARQVVRALKVGEHQKKKLFKLIDSETDMQKIKSAINQSNKNQEAPKPQAAPENKKVVGFEGK